ncbi:MAG: CPBP family intramembrane metalloprotease [Candidatus Saccharibacteria bacterium]|nr:CPBP family intramembrane metalloprotease [Candidatus Saccharibacteria bacterium]
MSTEKTTEKKQSATRKRNFIDDFCQKLEKKSKQSKGWELALNIVWVFMMLVWVAAVLVATQLLLRLVLINLMHLDQASMSTNALQTLYSALVYVVSLAITIFVPWKLAKSKTTRDELGLRGLPTWTDILLAPVGFIVFMIVAVILVAILQSIFPGINWNESQDVGFSNLISSSDFILAFISLVVVAPVAEELIFRGWLYGKLRAKIPAIPAMLVVSILFGIVHGQWNVGVTVFVMSIAMCTLREITGTIWGGILIHILKNGIAFYFLYVNPMMIQ